MRGAVLLLCLSVVGTTAQAADRNERLAKGEILLDMKDVAGSDVPEVFVTATIAAPPEKVWSIIDQCSGYTRIMSSLKSSKELTRVGNTVRCESLAKLPWPFDDLHAVLIAEHGVTPPKRWSRSWRLESGNYKENKGSWVLTPWGEGKTLLEYHMHTVPKIPLPAFVQTPAIRAAMPEMIEKLRLLVK